MLGRMDVDRENCLMFEWVKNVLQSNRVALVSVPRDPQQFRDFIDSYYDDSKENVQGTRGF